jgi:hypothetical protein
MGLRFVQSTRATINTGVGAGGINVYNAYVFADQAVAEVELIPPTRGDWPAGGPPSALQHHWLEDDVGRFAVPPRGAAQDPHQHLVRLTLTK